MIVFWVWRHRERFLWKLAEAMARPKYFTPSEVAAHCVPTDCWVSYLGRVYNLTPLCEEHAGNVLLKPITSSAGLDISHWFDPETKDVSILNTKPLQWLQMLQIYIDQDIHAPSGQSDCTIYSLWEVSAHPSCRSTNWLGLQLQNAVVEGVQVCSRDTV